MRLLVLRFSALGDVAMTVPVLRAFAAANPTVDVTVVSKSFHAPLFEDFHFRGFNLNDARYRGPLGIVHLIADIDLSQYDAVADLHDVLRTQAIRTVARLRGLQTSHIRKNRKARKALTRPNDKVLTPHHTSFEKYTAALTALGLTNPWPEGIPLAAPRPATTVTAIGIAPFAAHKGKIYPIEKMEQVVRTLSDRGIDTWLFGGGGTELATLQQWAERYANVHLARECCRNLSDELHLMSTLRLMLSMDSANMHLASLVGTRVVSIWGATHPLAGFMGWQQSESDALQLNLPCRPCSIFGSKPCLRGDYACMTGIDPELIVKHITE